MGRLNKYVSIMGVILFLFNAIIPSTAFSQAETLVMTLPDGTAISMTSAELSALAAQPGITIAAAPVVATTQVAIPIPAALGGGYIVGTPAAVASGIGATGIATGVTASAVVGATAAAGTITAGAMAGTVAALGVTGTVVAGTAVAAAVVAAAAAITEGEGATTHHH